MCNLPSSSVYAVYACVQAPDGRGLTIADYVNEDSKRATVTVTGTINQVGELQTVYTNNMTIKASK